MGKYRRLIGKLWGYGKTMRTREKTYRKILGKAMGKCGRPVGRCGKRKRIGKIMENYENIPEWSFTV